MNAECMHDECETSKKKFGLKKNLETLEKLVKKIKKSKLN